jgi:hypothetical protein
MMRAFIVVACASLLAGCAVGTASLAGFEPQAVTRETDSFRKVTTFKGPEVNHDGGRVFLRAFADAKGITTYELYYFDYFQSGHGEFRSATDASGKDLTVIPIERRLYTCNGYGCSYSEHVAVSLTRDYLFARSVDGLTIKLYGKTSEVVTLSGAYVKSFLQALP